MIRSLWSEVQSTGWSVLNLLALWAVARDQRLRALNFFHQYFVTRERGPLFIAACKSKGKISDKTSRKSFETLLWNLVKYRSITCPASIPINYMLMEWGILRILNLTLQSAAKRRFIVCKILKTFCWTVFKCSIQFKCSAIVIPKYCNCQLNAILLSSIRKAFQG